MAAQDEIKPVFHWVSINAPVTTGPDVGVQLGYSVLEAFRQAGLPIRLNNAGDEVRIPAMVSQHSALLDQTAYYVPGVGWVGDVHTHLARRKRKG
jgi:hypothetical protein